MDHIRLHADDRKAIDLFNRNIEWLKKKELKTEWVKASVIQSLTGWDADGMDRARRNNYIKFKKSGKVIWYDPSSIAQVFLKEK